MAGVGSAANPRLAIRPRGARTLRSGPAFPREARGGESLICDGTGANPSRWQGSLQHTQRFRPALHGGARSFVWNVLTTSSFFISPRIAWLGPVRTTRIILIGIGADVAVATVGDATSLLLAAAIIGATLSCPNPTFSAILGRYAPPRSIGLFLSVRYAASPAGIALTGMLLPLAITRADWRGSLWIVAAGCIAAGMAAGPAIPRVSARQGLCASSSMANRAS